MHSVLLDLELGRNAYGRLLREALEELAVDPREAVVLRLLAVNGESTLWQIRASTAMPPSTVRSISHRLVEDGLVVRFRVTSDRRFVWLELTRLGRVVASMIGEVIEEIAVQMGRVPSPDPESLVGVAGRLHALTAPRWGDHLS
jgi:DNA-binding MarR family transcriptional regulator